MPAAPKAKLFISLAVAAVSAFVGIAIFVGMLWGGERFVRLGLIGHTWYVSLLFLGLTVTICSFALFNSYALYTGRVLGGTVTVGGPVVAMGLVVVLGLALVPKPAGKFDVTVFVRVERGEQVQSGRVEGSLSFDLGSDRRVERIGERGEIRIVGIPAELRGRTVPVAIESQHYRLVNPQQMLLLNDEVLYVDVRPKLELVRGEVSDGRGRPLRDARLRLANYSTSTDELGRFSVSIPVTLSESERRVTVEAAGYEPWSGQFVPGSNPLTIRLDESKPTK